jgi:energy-coupling factor transporter ATP-binding protein EcfA2
MAMSETAKIKMLLQAWLDYIYLEELSNASIDAITPLGQNTWDKGVSIVGDNLLLSKSLFQELKEQYFSASDRQNKPETKLALALPQIYKVSKNQRQFRPVFTIDVSSLFLGKFRKMGWDLTEYNFQPVIPNLMELSQLDEEEVENLVTKEGLKVFIESTFKHPFSTLQDFLELVELSSSSLSLKRFPYLLRFDFVPANYNLKKDLQKISSQSLDSWAFPNHPAYEYLFGKPDAPTHEVLFFGAFPTDPPNQDQATALKHQRENSLTAVIGPPGNGKTTLLLHEIAVSVVERGYQLASDGFDQSNLTFVTSTNNRAVNNVLERLAGHFPDNSFYLTGGRKELIEKQVIPKLQAAIDWLNSETFSQNEWSQKSTLLIAGVKELGQQQELEREKERQKEHLLGTQEQLNKELAALNQQIETVFKQPSNDLPNYDQYPREAYEKILPYLEKAVKSLNRINYSQGKSKKWFWWQRVWYLLHQFWQKITKTSTSHIIKRLHREIEAPIMTTLATSFPFQLPLNRESLKAARVQVALQLEEVREIQARQSSHVVEQSEHWQQQREELTERLKQIEQQLSCYPTQDFYTRFPQENHLLQQQLFELAWQFLQLEAVRRRDEVIVSIRTYIDVINAEWDYEARRKLATSGASILRDVSLIFPVWASTLQSIRNLLPYPDSGCINRLIVDEAGMIPLHQLFPALVRCNKALIVGDPLQLEPIIPFNQSIIEQYHEGAFTERGLTDTDYERYSPTAIATATAYHRAAGVFDESSKIGSGIMLSEHHRCVPSIIDFCDRLCHYNLDLKTKDKKSKLGSNLIAYHVEGHYEQHTNLQEIEAIDSLVKHLVESGYSVDSFDDNTIGVISPYRAQADALYSRLHSKYRNFSRESIGTVHTFQGGEKSVIILSTRQCRDQDSFWFINRRPNLLNVSVSRAGELFILVGNLELLKQSGGYMRMLVEHIQRFGEIRQLP